MSNSLKGYERVVFLFVCSIIFPLIAYYIESPEVRTAILLAELLIAMLIVFYVVFNTVSDHYLKHDEP